MGSVQVLEPTVTGLIEKEWSVSTQDIESGVHHTYQPYGDCKFTASAAL